MIAPSELLTRHADIFTDTRLLIAGQLLDDYPIELAKVAEYAAIGVAHAGQAARYQHLAGDNTQVLLSAQPKLEKSYNTLLLYIPKAKQEADYWLNLCLSQLEPNADIFIVGENRGGINAAIKLLEKYQLNGRKVDAARRCSLIYAERGSAEIAFSMDDWWQSFTLNLNQGAIQVCSLPGVFNHGKLDHGTALLLDNLPPLDGYGLDFGCGAGIIGAAIAKQTGASINATDVSMLATLSTEKTFRQNQLTAQVFCRDGIDEFNQPFDFIVSNPPFHLGVKTEYETSRRFIALAAKKLKPGKPLYLVANSFLGYKELLESEFSHCEIVTDNRKFRIYHCYN
ncbi:methyltransferase [Celerinatantimonas diazotrophica]|uniref:Ribosomal RNA small subunit methyltransferase C n=1 Tax=Celerinatantimonas diazotrophica TaxID=412034 RepID=A0A4R1K286_9GAMM|nr:methyltransferase [Celerinatantimonas diazotrophica]TCK58136.1 16S rRNA m(2)G 1207 methyltransferase [Celerinatantimonas diazotrophica]CAG9297792.1 Ribosomal RNA small subunit methyltransferase C [Celerinatantimonas diazotrophica]